MLILNFSAAAEDPVVLLCMDVRNQVLLSALLLPFMYFKIALSLLFSRLNSLMQSFLQVMFLSILVIPIAFLWIFSSRPSFSSKCSANTGHSFTVEVLPMLRRMEGLLHISYKLYPCSYIPARCLSAGAHTQFEPEAFTFHRVA